MGKLRTGLLVLGAMGVAGVLQAQQWVAPTPEELSMTSQPEVPGAAAVYLNRDVATDDALHRYSYAVRLKVLTEEGKKYGDVQLTFLKGVEGVDTSVSDIAGRTIQPDGSIVPFTGKPYQKVIEQRKDTKVMSKMFSMPAVQVGRILEYRCKMRWADNWYRSPDWYPQEALFTRKSHYLWKPTAMQLRSTANGHEMLTNTIMWSPLLPAGTAVKDTQLPTGQHLLELSMTDIKPMPEEPISNASYRVNFYYSGYRTAEEYWRSEGKYWGRARDKFIGPGPAVKQFVGELVQPGETQDQKLRKIYAAVMEMENIDLTRQRSSAEERAEGLRDLKNADDILKRKRGSSDQLAAPFVGMARAAGMKAYLMEVVNREHRVFNLNYLSLYQLDDDIAIVSVDGKEKFFDPGARYCPYGHLTWRHTITSGLRQVDGGSSIAQTEAEMYTFSSLARIADLKLVQRNSFTGFVTETFDGDEALNWRHTALRGDETSLNEDLKKHMEENLPAGVDVSVKSVDNLTAYEKPLKVTYNVTGTAGNRTSTRLLLPADIFLVNDKPTFTQEKRELAVYFPQAHSMRDAVRWTFPSTYTLETAPAKSSVAFQKRAVHSMDNKTVGNSITTFRNLSMADFYFAPKEYPELRTFSSKFESADHESVVLKAVALPTAAKLAGQ